MLVFPHLKYLSPLNSCSVTRFVAPKKVVRSRNRVYPKQCDESRRTTNDYFRFQNTKVLQFLCIIRAYTPYSNP
ncbi:hypothetical protein KsCSTR_09110 [Candidatus Kuenenia stuttgartiensis]|uniref:Uncharacterized protein n=1 Tax=Kuenenia stuttgartiensis TaxID=174633 RepID=Q1PZ28_KUEST|nr:hypothetical protein KsCSTR_09110 [Candidatus Kuenenia stuttgartiensis]CAJ72344.1 unknown protein [Candidatus Kuenenia stuttgartiensis]